MIVRPRIGFTQEAMDTKTQIEMIALLAAQIDLADVEQLIAEYDRVEAIGPLFDPTAWMMYGRNLDGHRELACGFLTFRQAIPHPPNGDERCALSE